MSSLFYILCLIACMWGGCYFHEVHVVKNKRSWSEVPIIVTSIVLAVYFFCRLVGGWLPPLPAKEPTPAPQIQKK